MSRSYKYIIVFLVMVKSNESSSLKVCKPQIVLLTDTSQKGKCRCQILNFIKLFHKAIDHNLMQFCILVLLFAGLTLANTSLIKYRIFAFIPFPGDFVLQPSISSSASTPQRPRRTVLAKQDLAVQSRFEMEFLGTPTSNDSLLFNRITPGQRNFSSSLK